MNRFKHWLYHASVVVGVILIGAFLVVSSGIVPVRASSGHWPITEWLLKYAMKRTVTTYSLGVTVPNLDDHALILKGAGHYETGCRACHGSPGMRMPLIAQRMTPPAPELTGRIDDLGPKRLFYVVKHGLKFTGMPAWPAQSRDDEVWAVVAFLKKLPELDDEGYHRLVHGETVAADPIQALTLSPVSSVALQSCVRCHGSDGSGRGSDAFPKLAGQRREYLQTAMEAYATSERHSGIMQPVAAGLSKETVEQLVNYYAALPAPPATPPAPTHREAIARGREIALHGLPAQRVPACVECHDVRGKQRKPDYPTLAGQPARYLELQLTLFQADQRGGSDYAHLMQPIAARLTPEQMRDVARYFEAQP
ncbi:c-type cytochrome [Oleiharenicola lentus]|uniref:c-type cytochrome n=1 Tax=Oleiharenicola lentus TaxID=2508720 RepID=UPI003F66C6B0